MDTHYTTVEFQKQKFRFNFRENIIRPVNDLQKD